MARWRYQYCKVIVATSLVWFLLDVILLMYYTDCATPTCDKDNQAGPAKSGGILDRILPKGNSGGTLLCLYNLYCAGMGTLAGRKQFGEF